MPYTRVFLPLELALRFREIHKMEQRLRQYIGSQTNLEKPIPIDRSTSMKVTRGGVLDPNYIDLFEPEDQRYPTYPEMWLPTGEYETIKKRVETLLDGAALPRKMNPETPHEISFEQLVDLVSTFPFRAGDSFIGWVPTALVRVLEQHRARSPGQRAWLYVREMNRRVTKFSGGALSGAEVVALQKHRGPVFCAFWDQAAAVETVDEPPARRYWYPTLVFDETMARVVVNVSPT
jgi:hypothetical protein